MVKNDILLKYVMLFCIFWIIHPYTELVGLFVGLGKSISGYFGLIVAAVIAYFLNTVAYHRVKNSILRRNSLSTPVRWLLYAIVGLTILTALITLVDTKIYAPFSVRQIIFTGEAFARIKAFALLLLILTVSGYATFKLVNSFGYQPTLDTQIKAFNPNAAVAPLPNQVNSQNYTEQNFQQPQTTQRIKNDRDTLHGSARFSDPDQFNETYNKKSNKEIADQFENTPGYVIQPGQIKFGEHAHMVTIAGSGQGKGVSMIIPNLLTRPSNSWVVLDVKGENAAVTARFQKFAGQKVYLLDPFEVQKHIGAKHGITSSGFNPLTVAKYLPEGEINEFASMIAEMFIPASQSATAGSNAFWVDSARNLLKTYVLYLITDNSITEKHLGKIYEWLRLDQDNEIKLLAAMGLNQATTFAANEIKSLVINGDRTWLGILSEARNATAFLESPLIQKSLHTNDFDPMTLQTNNTTLYVVLPERNLHTHKAWLRMVFGSILKLCNFTAQRRVNFLMDEFPILGRMDDFQRAFAFGRGQKISCWLIAQSLSQLKDIYGEEGLNNFLANARLRQFFGVNDYYSQKYVSDLLGMTTEYTNSYNKQTNSGGGSSLSDTAKPFGSSRSTNDNWGTSLSQSESITARPLMTPDEVGGLRNDFILLVDGDKYRIPKLPYFSSRFYSGRFDPNPYVS